MRRWHLSKNLKVLSHIHVGEEHSRQRVLWEHAWSVGGVTEASVASMQWAKGKLVGDEVREVGVGQTKKGLVDHFKGIGFSSEWDGQPLKDFEQRYDMIWLTMEKSGKGRIEFRFKNRKLPSLSDGAWWRGPKLLRLFEGELSASG